MRALADLRGLRKPVVRRWGASSWSVWYRGRFYFFASWDRAVRQAVARYMADLANRTSADEAEALIHNPETPEGFRQALMDAFVPCSECGQAVHPDKAYWLDKEPFCANCDAANFDY